MKSRMVRTMRISDMVLRWLVGLFAVWVVCAALGVFGQRKLFYEEGREELYDFWMPRMCYEQGYVGHPEKWDGWHEVRTGKPIVVDEHDVVWSDWYTDGSETHFVTGWRDKVYPKVALWVVAPFPASRTGGYVWCAFAGLILLGVMCGIAKSWKPLLLALSMPFLFNVERGNPIWLSAACVAVFLAWWDDDSEWKSLCAAGCLAIAAAMKIAPCVLGVVYFTRWRWRPIIFSAVMTLTLVFVPWFFDRDGFAALAVMMRNASIHAQYVLRASDFGLVELWRTVRLVLGLNVQDVWPGMMIVVRFSQILGVLVLILGARRRDYLLLVGGMLLIAGNMYYYAALYLLPVFVIERIRNSNADGDDYSKDFPSRYVLIVESFLWLAMFCPLQLVFLGHSANQVICNSSLLILMSIRVFLIWMGKDEMTEKEAK